MIQVEGLTKYYGAAPAIDGVSFRVEAGEIVGFLGPNAAGKTTTMRILAGYMPATRGKAVVAGFDLAQAPLEVKRRVGYMPENVPLYLEMVVGAFLRYVAEIKNVPRAQVRGEVGRVMERCGLGHMQNRIIRNLSKGYRQRVGLAQALIGSPPVLILDEPTVGLDPSQIIEIREMIRGLAGEHTLLLSSHILPEVAMVCKRVIIIHQGHIVAEDTMDNLAGKATGQQIDIEAEGLGATIREIAESVPGVRFASPEGAMRYRITAEENADPRAALVSALVERGICVRGLSVRRRTLEDVFVEAISHDHAAGKGGPRR